MKNWTRRDHRSFTGFSSCLLTFQVQDRRKEEAVMFILSVLMHPAGLVLIALLVIGHALTRTLLGGD